MLKVYLYRMYIFKTNIIMLHSFYTPYNFIEYLEQSKTLDLYLHLENHFAFVRYSITSSFVEIREMNKLQSVLPSLYIYLLLFFLRFLALWLCRKYTAMNKIKIWKWKDGIYILFAFWKMIIKTFYKIDLYVY